MATKSPGTSPAPGTKKSSVKPDQTLDSGIATPPADPNAKIISLKPGEDTTVVDPNASPPPPKPSPPPAVFRPWLRTIRPPWEKAPRPPPSQRPWKPFKLEMLRKCRLPPQVEFHDAFWTRTMLDITMKKRYPKVVKMQLSSVKVTFEKHEGPIQVSLEPLAKRMPNYPECRVFQFSTTTLRR